jgi:hypothetical protein
MKIVNKTNMDFLHLPALPHRWLRNAQRRRGVACDARKQSGAFEGIEPQILRRGRALGRSRAPQAAPLRTLGPARGTPLRRVGPGSRLRSHWATPVLKKIDQ